MTSLGAKVAPDHRDHGTLEYVDVDGGTRVVLEARPQDPLGEDGSGIRLGWRPDDTIVLTR